VGTPYGRVQARGRGRATCEHAVCACMLVCGLHWVDQQELGDECRDGVDRAAANSVVMQAPLGSIIAKHEPFRLQAIKMN